MGIIGMRITIYMHNNSNLDVLGMQLAIDLPEFQIT